MPATACVAELYFDSGCGRDLVASEVRADWSAFERPLPAVLHACASRFPGLTVDVGANTGYYALLAAVSAAKARVLAFEPDATVFPLLESNVARNRLADRIACHPVALSDRAGTASLYVPTQEHGLVESSSSLEAEFKDAHSEVRQVPVTTLDGFLGRWRYRFARIALIKIDVEGHEAAVLRGARRVVRRWRPIVFVEVLPRADSASLNGFLAVNRYVDLALHPDRLAEPQAAVAYQPDAWNHALVPAERANQVGALIQACVG